MFASASVDCTGVPMDSISVHVWLDNGRADIPVVGGDDSCGGPVKYCSAVGHANCVAGDWRTSATAQLNYQGYGTIFAHLSTVSNITCKAV